MKYIKPKIKISQKEAVVFSQTIDYIGDQITNKEVLYRSLLDDYDLINHLQDSFEDQFEDQISNLDKCQPSDDKFMEIEFQNTQEIRLFFDIYKNTLELLGKEDIDLIGGTSTEESQKILNNFKTLISNIDSKE